MSKRVLLACSLIFVLACALFGFSIYFGTSPLTKPVSISIPRGSTADDVAQILHGEGVIRNTFYFRLVLRIRGSANRIQAGSYRFEPGVRMKGVIEALEQGKTERISVLVREGSTLRMIGKLLEDAKITSSIDFMKAAVNQDLLDEFKIPGASFEGYLFPDTYYFSPGLDASAVLRAMTATFFKKIATLTGGSFSPEALHSKLILSSIVEREYRRADEAPLIASVFLNRLSLRMPLQSCATVVYILTEKQGKPHPDIVLYADLEIHDSYNTYRNRGLPPGPIANPGETALKAVFNPAKSDYLYFRLVDGVTGTHRFSKTFDEHTQAAIPVKGF